LFCGIAAIGWGVFLILLSIAFQDGIPGSFSNVAMIGFLLVGVGLGYFTCLKSIYDLEKKSQK